MTHRETAWVAHQQWRRLPRQLRLAECRLWTAGDTSPPEVKALVPYYVLIEFATYPNNTGIAARCANCNRGLVPDHTVEGKCVYGARSFKWTVAVLDGE